MSNTSLAEKLAPKFGYVPTTFPRDVSQVNQFAEHVVLGQILEPLVDADRTGKLTTGIAESWVVSQDGKSIVFKIGANQYFSNGKPVQAKDVKFSLDRHLHEKTQSSNFVRAIKEVKIKSNLEVEIVLSEPNVSILKALTRDHLGILPEGWKYDSASDEPIIGSGPYRLKRKGSKWLLVKNERFTKTSVSVPEWELVFYKNEAFDLPDGVLPDYVPVATNLVVDELKALAAKQKVSLTTEEQFGFAQTSLWWYPHGAHYRSEDIKSKAMNFLNELVEKKTEEKKLQRATGIVPVGVAGFLPEPMKFDWKSQPQSHNPKTKLSFAGLGNAFAFLFEGETAKQLAAKYGIEIEFFTFTPSELTTIKNRKPDVLMASWAGGFNDPEGFLPLLNQVLGVDFIEYLEDLRPIYQSARVEQDWTKRSELFREFNKKIVLQKRMVPGWKLNTFSVARSGLAEEKVGFRYTPRLSNVKRTN